MNICKHVQASSMCKAFNSFSYGLLLVFWYIITGENDRES